LPDAFSFEGQRDSLTYKQLGNGVNVGVVWNVLKAQVARDEDILKGQLDERGREVGTAIFRAITDAPADPDEPVSAALAAGHAAFKGAQPAV
jgi:DNA (cytosine-5)-methyltransferase 1